MTARWFTVVRTPCNVTIASRPTLHTTWSALTTSLLQAGPHCTLLGRHSQRHYCKQAHTAHYLVGTHVDQFEGAAVLLHGDPEDGMQLTGQHVDSRPCGESADEWVGQEGGQESQTDHSQEDLDSREGGG